MNKVQIETVNMFDSMGAFYMQNKMVSDSIPALATGFTDLELIRNTIHSKSKLQLAATEGYTNNKDANKETLCIIANEVAGVVFTWANDTNDMVTMAKVKTNISILGDLGMSKLANTCALYFDIAITHQAALADYGISKLDLETFSNAINNYRSAMPSNRNAVSDRKAYRFEIDSLIKKGKLLLRNKFDKLVVRFKKTNPEYYNRYKSNRVIINKGSRSTAFRLLITDAKTGGPIAGASVAIAALNLQATSNKQGLVMAKPVPIGLYDMVVQKEGYATETLAELKAVQGKTNRVEVVLRQG